MIRKYYSLAKPGIVYGNALTAVAGFFLASKGELHAGLLAAMLGGLSLIVASACVFNNVIDRDIDVRMARTQERELPRGIVSARAALMYAACLGLLGSFILFRWTNTLALAVALVGFLVYVFPYSMWGKRRTPYATHIGSIAGAVPPVVGYTAVTHGIDAAAVILFATLCAWQTAHFFGIALYRQEEYAAAGVPVWPVAKGIESTKRQMFFFIVMYIIAAALLTVLGFTGYLYLAVTLLAGLIWFGLGMRGLRMPNVKRWGRNMFLFSLLVITAFCVAIPLDAVFRF